MKIPSIHVGCGEFSLQRLELLINGNQFSPIACVDIDVEKAKTKLSSLKTKTYEDLMNRVYTTITEAKKSMMQKFVLFLFLPMNMQN